MRLVRLAARGSPLSQKQVALAAAALATRWRGCRFQHVKVETQGDLDRRSAPGDLGRMGIFQKEVDAEVLEGRADLAVHSLKDLPTGPLAEGLELLAVLPRGAPEDALVGAEAAPKWSELPRGAVVGTSSARRRAIALFHAPRSAPRAVRGNVGTRLAKLRKGEYDALLLAEAGLVRLGFGFPRTLLSPLDDPPAPGQGFVALVGRPRADPRVRALPKAWPLDLALARVERTFLEELGGGCSEAVGGYAWLPRPGRFALVGAEWQEDGSARRRARGTGTLSESLTVARETARRLRDAPWRARP